MASKRPRLDDLSGPDPVAGPSNPMSKGTSWVVLQIQQMEVEYMVRCVLTPDILGLASSSCSCLHSQQALVAAAMISRFKTNAKKL
jgi:hypothetical protein